MKENFAQPLTQSKEVDTNSFSEMQKLPFNMVTKHSENTEEPLLLIINGEAGTGKSYLINALRNHLQHRCIVTATTGKASYQIQGIAFHSYLRLPIGPNSQRELNGQPLIDMQKKLSTVDYIIIDEYSMLGQKKLLDGLTAVVDSHLVQKKNCLVENQSHCLEILHNYLQCVINHCTMQSHPMLLGNKAFMLTRFLPM